MSVTDDSKDDLERIRGTSPDEMTEMVFPLIRRAGLYFAVFYNLFGSIGNLIKLYDRNSFIILIILNKTGYESYPELLRTSTGIHLAGLFAVFPAGGLRRRAIFDRLLKSV